MTYSIVGESKSNLTFAYNQDGTFYLYTGAGAVCIQPENATGLARYILSKTEKEDGSG